MKDAIISPAEESFVILDDDDPLLDVARDVGHDQAQAIAAGPSASRRPAFPGRPASHPSPPGQNRPDVGLIIVRQVAALATMDTAALRQQWRCVFKGEPPAYAKELLRRRLAYRLQELAYGGLSEAVRERLREVESPQPKAGNLTPGTMLIREHRGIRHEVLVLGDGFQFQGKTWKSLSGIAKAIVGSQTDGPLFFGLRKKARRA